MKLKIKKMFCNRQDDKAKLWVFLYFKICCEQNTNL